MSIQSKVDFLEQEVKALRQQMRQRPITTGRDTTGEQVLTQVVRQSAHGFIVKDVLRHNGAAWVKSQADTAANAVVGGIVVAVVDTGKFIIATSGYVVGLSGLTAGAVHYLSAATAGALTTTAPAIAVSVLSADSTSSGHLQAFAAISASPSIRQTYHAVITTAGAKTISFATYPATYTILVIGGGGGGGGSAIASGPPSQMAPGGGGSSGVARMSTPKTVTGAVSLTATIGAAGGGGAYFAGTTSSGAGASGTAGGETGAVVPGWWDTDGTSTNLDLRGEGGAAGGGGSVAFGTSATSKSGAGGATAVEMSPGGIEQPFPFFCRDGQSAPQHAKVGTYWTTPAGPGGKGVYEDSTAYGYGGSGGYAMVDGTGYTPTNGTSGTAGAIVIIASSAITVT